MMSITHCDMNSIPLFCVTFASDGYDGRHLRLNDLFDCVILLLIFDIRILLNLFPLKVIEQNVKYYENTATHILRVIETVYVKTFIKTYERAPF